MMFRKKHKEDNTPKETKMQDKVAKGIAGFLLSLQNWFASFMSARINFLTKKAKQVFLILFCCVFGGLSIYAFIGAFKTSKSGKGLKPSQLSVPKYYNRTDGEIKGALVSEREIIRINRFKKYMDSLNHSVKGKLVYDSIRKVRHGLMDSITAIEEIYYSQSK